MLGSWPDRKRLSVPRSTTRRSGAARPAGAAQDRPRAARCAARLPARRPSPARSSDATSRQRERAAQPRRADVAARARPTGSAAAVRAQRCARRSRRTRTRCVRALRCVVDQIQSRADTFEQKAKLASRFGAHTGRWLATRRSLRPGCDEALRQRCSERACRVRVGGRAL